MINLSNLTLKTKIILAILAVVILAESGWLIYSLTQKNQTGSRQAVGGNIFNISTTDSSVTGDDVQALISLSSPKTTFKVGEKIPVTINVSSKRSTDGIDIIMLYDANLLSLEPFSPTKAIAPGTIYTDFPINSTDSIGRVTVSGVTSQASGIVPNGVFGTVNFVSKAVGTAKINLDFTNGSTIDTNVIESKTSKDVLGKVENLEVVIQ